MTDFDFDAELGYTPKNLKNLRVQYKLTQTDVARIVGVKNHTSIARWETSLEQQGHADMPLKKWALLLAYLTDKNSI